RGSTFKRETQKDRSKASSPGRRPDVVADVPAFVLQLGGQLVSKSTRAEDPDVLHEPESRTGYPARREAPSFGALANVRQESGEVLRVADVSRVAMRLELHGHLDER